MLIVNVLTVVISILALVVSIVTTRQNLRTTQHIATDASENARKLAQDATYQRLHEMLVDPKAAAGRRRLFQAAKRSSYPVLGEDGWDEINYSLALYDTLAGYVSREQIPRETVLDAWHHPLSNIAPAVREFMSHRSTQDVRQPWAHLMKLLKDAEQYPCQCPVVPAHNP